MPFEQVSRLTKQGVMPHLKEIIDGGTFGRMYSSLPDNSAVSWSSMITGANPGQHGIYGFTELLPGTYNLSYPNFNKLKVQPFWLKHPHKRYVILNVPFTYPVKPLNGVHVSGFISLDMARAVYPSEFNQVVTSLDYQIDVDTTVYHRSKELFMKQIKQVLRKRMELVIKTWKTRWDVFMAVFTGTDRINHMMWDVYENKTNGCHQDFLDYYTQLDTILGWMYQNKKPEDQMILLSDHGMEQIDLNVHVNRILESYGFLKADGRRGRYTDIEKGTKAFCLEPSRIYVNRDKQYPNGSVDLRDVNKVTNDLFDMFSQLTYKDRPVIKQIFRRDDVFHGPCVNSAPDLVLIPHKGFNLRGGMMPSSSFSTVDWVQGHHTWDNAFLITRDMDYPLMNHPSIDQVLELFHGRLT